MEQDQSLRRHGAEILRLGLPLVGSQLAQFSTAIVDTVMLGWYDVTALAAVALGGGAIYFLLFLLGAGFASAVMPVVAEALAAGKPTRVRRVTRMAMWLSFFFVVAVLPGLIFSGPLLRHLGQKADVADLAGQYLRIYGWTLFPALQVMVLKSYLSALERTRVLFWVTLAGAVLNGLLNYALIFGHWWAPELGVRGAAWASLASTFLAWLMLVFYVVRATPEHAVFSRLWRPDWPAFRHVFSLGWPIGLTGLAEMGLFSVSAVMMGWLGKVPLAAHGVALQLVSISFMVQVALSYVATIRAGKAFGRGDEVALRQGAKALLGIGAFWALTSAAGFLLAPEPLLRLYLDPGDPAQPAVIAVGGRLLAVGAIFMLVDAGQVLGLGLLRGVQDTHVPMALAAISYWLIGLPAGYVLGIVAGLGGVGVWLGLTLGLACAALSMLWRFWCKKARIPAGRQARTQP